MQLSILVKDCVGYHGGKRIGYRSQQKVKENTLGGNSSNATAITNTVRFDVISFLALQPFDAVISIANQVTKTYCQQIELNKK